jgi:hypothetical protein
MSGTVSKGGRLSRPFRAFVRPCVRQPGAAPGSAPGYRIGPLRGQKRRMLLLTLLKAPTGARFYSPGRSGAQAWESGTIATEYFIKQPQRGGTTPRYTFGNGGPQTPSLVTPHSGLSFVRALGNPGLRQASPRAIESVPFRAKSGERCCSRFLKPQPGRDSTAQVAAERRPGNRGRSQHEISSKKPQRGGTTPRHTFGNGGPQTSPLVAPIQGFCSSMRSATPGLRQAPPRAIESVPFRAKNGERGCSRCLKPQPGRDATAQDAAERRPGNRG